jgi:glucose/arabinose dehydrogenase
MTRRSLMFSLLFVATLAQAADSLRHHDIRFDDLPQPFATASANNGPNIVPQPPGVTLNLPPHFHIKAWATNLSNPRMMLLAPNGDVFLSEPDAGLVTVLRDNNEDGVADQRFTFVSGLSEPFGLALHGGFLYVGATNRVVRYPYTSGQVVATGSSQTIATLSPGGHSTRNLLFSRDGSKLYVSIGSSSNVDPESDSSRATITEMNPDGSGRRIFASGLRNPVGLALEPVTNTIWTAVNERDGLGDDLVPDYVTRVDDNAFYGWPYAYLGPHQEPRLAGQRPDLVAKTVAPSVLLQAHSASLGIAFYQGTLFPGDYNGDAFVALHGSWNRSKRTGYKVVRVPMQDGQPLGGYDDFIAGWSPNESSANVWGRPVGLLVLEDGSLLVSDDGARTIWRVTYERPPKTRAVRHQ